MSDPGTAAAEAVARAKAIAARLSGSVTPSVTQQVAEGTDSDNAGGKRKRWGVMPAAANNGVGSAAWAAAGPGASAELPGLSEAAKKQKLATEPTEKRLWVMSTSSEKPISHFVAFLSPKLDNIVLGINKEMAEKQPPGNGKDKDAPPKFAIELRGRGSSRPPPLPGMPELPLHIMLLGLPEAITRAEPIVEPLLYDAENAPLEQLSPEMQEQQQQMLLQQQQQQSYEGALTVQGGRNGGNNNMANYRPTSVAQLIGQANMSPEDAMVAASQMQGQGLEEEVLVPNGVVGFIIGRGGENISSMQAKTGCKVQIQKEHELQPGQAQRVITLQAMRQEQIDECRALIENMVQERVQASGGRGGPGGGGGMSSGGGPKEGRVQDALAGGHELVQVDIPDADVGLIIGKMGSTIKSIQEQSGASVQVPQAGNVDNPSMRTVSITHPTEQGAMYAKQMIEDLLKSKPSYAGGGGGGGQGQFSIQVPVSTQFRYRGSQCLCI
jgi:transcription antitermination factor NusA-like protein